MHEMHEFSPELLRSLQLKSLEMTKYFMQFCSENGLLFYFCGGCCIGALRHKGFIPWDDDVDLFMPRNDYEKLKDIWNVKADTERYSLVCSGEHLTDHNLFVTIRDNRTTFIKPYQQDLDIPHGIPLDVFPLDGYPSSRWQRNKQVFWALLYSLYCAQLVPENHGGGTALLGRIALGIVPSGKLRYKLWRFAERHMSRYPMEDCDSITELCAGPGYMKNRYPKKAFDSAVYKEFEGELMPLPVGYNEYLAIAFGNYMQPPSEKNQVAHHAFVFCDLNQSYKIYKGIYYGVSRKGNNVSVGETE